MDGPIESRFRAFADGKISKAQFLDLDLGVEFEEDGSFWLSKGKKLARFYADGMRAFLVEPHALTEKEHEGIERIAEFMRLAMEADLGVQGAVGSRP